MLKKQVITFLFVTFFIISSAVSTNAGETQNIGVGIHSIVPADQTAEILVYTGPDKKPHVAKIIETRVPEEKVEIWIDDELQDERKMKRDGYKFEDFIFCLKKDEKKDADLESIKFGPGEGDDFVCHSLKDARNGSFLIGNHVKCPYFIKTWGIIVELCPHNH